MPTPKELEAKLWKALESDRTVMLGIDGAEGGYTRPMTAIVEDGHGPLWFFAGKPNALVDMADSGRPVIASFSSKGHDLFASISGQLHVDNRREVIDRLWNPFIAAWFDGKDDPKLVLLRMDADHAEIWENENNLLAGIKLMLGVDPKKDYADHQANVDLR